MWASAIGEVGYWLVWLLGLIAALNSSGSTPGVMSAPLNNMVHGFVTYLPSVVGAALIFFIGFVLATIVRRMVEAAVEAVETRSPPDRRGAHAHAARPWPRAPARHPGVHADHHPGFDRGARCAGHHRDLRRRRRRCSNDILLTIPRVIGAALIIFIAYVIGRWIMTLIEEGLKSIGFDDIITSIANAEPIRVGCEKMDLTPGVDTVDFSRLPAFADDRARGADRHRAVRRVEAARLLEFGAMAAMLTAKCSTWRRECCSAR